MGRCHGVAHLSGREILRELTQELAIDGRLAHPQDCGRGYVGLENRTLLPRSERTGGKRIERERCDVAEMAGGSPLEPVDAKPAESSLATPTTLVQGWLA